MSSKYSVPCSQGPYSSHETEILRYKWRAAELVLMYEFPVHRDATFEMLERCLDDMVIAARVSIFRVYTHPSIFG